MKKLLSLLMVFIMLFAFTPFGLPVFSQGKSVILGDINNDGKINSADYLIAKRIFLGSYNATEAQLVAADVNIDGKVNSADYLMIKRHFLGTYTIKDPNAGFLKTNYHGHTYRCNHAGTSTDEQYIQAAIANGYDLMGFTDHVMLPWIEYYHSVRGKYSESHEYLESIRSLQEQYADQIYILLGYECEWNELFEGYYRHLLDNNLVDYLIMGNHYLEFDTITNRFDYFNGSMESIEFVKAYTESSIQGMESGLFSIFAHPDYVLYYAKMWNATVEDYMRQMCIKAKELGVALEYNHGYAYAKFWDVVKEVGNTVVIGLDAHDPSVYSSSKRSQSIAFLNSKGIPFVEDLGITKKQPKVVTQTYEVTVTNGTGTGTYKIFENVEIRAEVGEGQIFEHWLINGVKSDKPAAFNFVVEGDTTIVAVFEEDTEIGYSYAFDYVPSKGDNVYGSLTWNFSKESYGLETGSSSSRGVAFRVFQEPSKAVVIKTTVTRYQISKIIVEAAMGSGNDTTISISVGGTNIISDYAVTNHNTAYAFDVSNLNGEIIITLKATVTDKASYIKSIQLIP